MIKIIILSIIIAIGVYLIFTLYCVLAIKKTTPRPARNVMSHMRGGVA